MTLSQRPRKLLLAVHLVSSIGWVGALTAFLVLALAGLLGGDDRTVRAAYIAMDLVTWFAIVPLAFVSLLSGIVQALATPWGLIRNYWVLFKLVIVVTATYMLIGKTGPIGLMADAAVAMPLR